MSIGEMTLEHAAKDVAGNWKRFESFLSYRASEIDDPDDWAIVYTHNRDSGVLDQSNADAIAESLELFTEGNDPDVVMESHSHWAVGHVDGSSIRVYRHGAITDAFRTYHDLMDQLDEYPILDEKDYSNREYETTLDNITDAAWRVKHDYSLPEAWESDVYSWFSDNRHSAIENRDDQGGYPQEDDLRDAFDALGYVRIKE
jgi:hypothetical protein